MRLSLDLRLPYPTIEAVHPKDRVAANVFQSVLEYEWDRIMNSPARIAQRAAFNKFILGQTLRDD